MGVQMSNDARGWIMTVTSGIACVLGASIICVDLIIRRIPSKRDFRIQDSNVFLAASLSLSFGVMLFSSLYSMLPSSKNYLIKAGLSPSAAAWILLACFMGGFVGIQFLSRFLHNYIPSHVVDCDHSHKEPVHGHDHEHHHSRRHSHGSRIASRRSSHGTHISGASNGKATESTPLISSENGSALRSTLHDGVVDDGPRSRTVSDSHERRPSMVEVHNRLMSFVKDTKPNCDEGGPCFGYSDPCGQECFKHIGPKSPIARSPTNTRHPTLLRITTGPLSHIPSIPPILDEEDEISSTLAVTSPRLIRAHSHEPMDEGCESDMEAQHHHHVPENAFMSIGLQTSIAIALHKLPEGFITYATNHANPSLGFSVFMALFIHNITEGFAMALPLFLALGNRGHAMLWASLLGGISQPLGAGIAAAWFNIAGQKGHKPGFEVYGCMFAITSGIMASVGLQLFVESLSLNHNRNLCIAFAFVGMAIMGTSNALTS